jgi:lipopolysaccharide biosynthesis regulator YciM
MSFATTLLLFTLLLMGVAAGWYLGFRQGSLRRRLEEGKNIRQYLESVVRSGETGPESSLTAVARALAFDVENFEAHLSLGAMFRRRGELGRATELHERLRGLDGITREQADHADFELGRDYFVAGMLDRAEMQFQGLVDRQSQFAQQALRQLVRIYELERDWHSALTVAERLAAVEPSVSTSAAHYCCELAEKELGAGESSVARRLLRRALDFDQGCIRARLDIIELDILAGSIDSAIGELRTLLQENPVVAPLARDVLARWLARLPVPGGQPAPSPEALFAAAMPESEPPSPQSGYVCSQCGFNARGVLWMCPGCHGWGTLAPAVRSQENRGSNQ